MSLGIQSKTFATAVFAVSCLAFGLVGSAQQPSTPAALPDVQKLGPQVGSRVPSFTLRDQQGQSRTLASLMGPRGLMLVFLRSADWCPYCKTQLAELQARSAELKKSGLGIAAITYDPAPVLAEFAKRRAITFPLLSDPGSVTIKQYGILNTTVPESNVEAYGVPFPGTFMVTPQGVVASRFFEQAYQERNTVSSIMARLGNNVDAPSTTTLSFPQVEITSFVTDATVAPGTHFSVVVDVQPDSGVRVYAPGVKGYKPVRLSVASQPGVVIGPSQYPPSVDYGFQALNEHIPVYLGAFRVVQDLVIDASPQGQAALKDVTALTINGVLNYQACDDSICFNPQTVPLTWKVTLRQLDKDRVNP